MASLRDIASILAERAGKQRDPVFLRELEDIIVLKRARILANTLSKDTGKARFYLQKFKVKLKKIDLTDECSEKIDPKCSEKAFRSIEKIPHPIVFGAHPFEYVGSIGGYKAYGFTTFGNEQFLQHRPLVGKNARYTYVSEYLYIFNRDSEEVQIEGVFPDPRKLKRFQSCGDSGKVCWAEEQEGFIEAELAELVIKDTMQNELRLNLPNEAIQVKTDQNV